MKANFKKLFSFNDRDSNSPSEDEYYNISNEEAGVEGGEGSKLILVEPRAYSESQQIADHLKNRHTVEQYEKSTKIRLKRMLIFKWAVYVTVDLQKSVAKYFYVHQEYECSRKNYRGYEKGKTNNDIGIDF